ncbi:MAG: hypothetical protein JW809_10515 [Pirellulales bacterium]|nr:hypothetical protein [Pirellulales bacterium]
MAEPNSPVCCPPFDPGPWDEKTIHWEGKRFVQDRVRCFLHIPLNFGGVMRRNMARIEAAGAVADEVIVLDDNVSLWASNVYIGVARDVPGANMVTLSGTFLGKVFEGPYSNTYKWMRQMREFVARQGKQIKHEYTFYTTCPKCAKKYGKNYVVMLAQVY